MSRTCRRTWTRPVLKRKTLAPKKRFESSRRTGGKHKPTQTELPRSLSRELARTGTHHHDGESVVASMSTELSHIFVASDLLTDRQRTSSPLIQNSARPTALTWPCNTSASLRGSALLPESRSSLTAVKLSFPALLLDDGRIICSRTSDQRPQTLVPRPTDNPKRAAEMKALIERHSSSLH